jgi:Mg/Co/Ni transporter MgtE
MSKWGYDLALSERVQELLGYDTFGELLNIIEAELKDEIFKTATSEARDQLYYEMHALNRVKIKIQSIANDVKYRGEL